MGDVVLKRLQVAPEGGLTSGAASVYNGGSAVAATRRLAVDDSTEFGFYEYHWETPEETRGTYAAYYTHILHMKSAKGKFGALVYPDDVVFYLKAVVSGSPTTTTLPTAPDVLLAATAIAATMSLTTQPNAAAAGGAAEMLAVTLSNGTTSATAVTATITGTDINGNALVEVLAFANGTQTVSKVGGGAGALTVTLYTTNFFKTVNASGIATSAQPSGDQVAVAGVCAFKHVFTPDMASSTIVSLTGEYFDGSTNWQLPGMILPKFDFELDVGKSFKLKADAITKDMLDQASITSLTDQVLPAISSGSARFYSDAIGSTPGTTQISGRLLQGTFSIENALSLGKTADGTLLASFVGRKRYKTKVDLTLLLNSARTGSEDPADMAAFMHSQQSRTIMIALPALSYLPCGVLSASSNWPTQLQDANNKGGLYGILISHAGKYITGAPADVEGRLAVKLAHDMEVDLTTMNASYQVTVVNRMNPNSF